MLGRSAEIAAPSLRPRKISPRKRGKIQHPNRPTTSTHPYLLLQPIFLSTTLLDPSLLVGSAMRIRKNAKLSSLLFTQGGQTSELPPVYMCQLNQSPWDVIPFASLPDVEVTLSFCRLLFTDLPASSLSRLSPIHLGFSETLNPSRSFRAFVSLLMILLCLQIIN